MKKYLIALAMLLTLSTAAPVAAQKHRHNPAITATVNNKTVKQSSNTTDDGGEGIVAYSDTTSIDTTAATTSTTTVGMDDDYSGSSDEDQFFSFISRLMGILGGTFGGFVAVLATCLVFLFLAAPFIVLFLIVWLLLRNRNRKYRLVEKAMESGQQIPEELLHTEAQGNDYLWRRGIRNGALGLGLVVFFYCLGADPLTGIGWLVFCYGAGQAVIAKTTNRKDDDSSENPNQSGIN